MTCLFCEQAIEPGQPVNHHHTIYRSRGGTETAPSHEDCHIAYHSTHGDFKVWGSEGGKLSALTRRWSFNLKNVNQDPAHEINRSFYLALYAHQ